MGMVGGGVGAHGCKLAATILILFVQTDPVPFYFQLVENKLVLFLLSVSMTTQPFLVELQSQGKANGASFCRAFFSRLLVKLKLFFSNIFFKYFSI